MDYKKGLTWIKVLSVLAIIVSAYLAYQHYEVEDSDFCVFGASFDCNIVNKSPYANVDGLLYFLVFDMEMDIPYVQIPIPNAILSIVFFLFLFFAARSLQHKKPLFGMQARSLIKLMKTLLYLSLAYAIYLVYIEAFILLSYCVFCITLDVIIVLALFITIKLSHHKPARSMPARKAPVRRTVPAKRKTTPKRKTAKRTVKRRRRR